MKRTFLKTISAKFLPLLFIVTPFFSTTQSFACDRNQVSAGTNEKSASVVYSGSTDNAMMFDVKINNPRGSRFTLVVQGDDGEVLYAKNYSEKHFVKKIIMLKSHGGVNRFSFTIRSTDKSLENTFTISTVTRVVEDVVVTNL